MYDNKLDRYTEVLNWWSVFKIITGYNATQKFILFFSISSDRRLTCIKSLLLVFVSQLLWGSSSDTLKNFTCPSMILSTDPTLRLNSSAISRTVICLLARMHVSSWLMFWSVIVVRGALAQTSSLRDWRPLLKPSHHSHARQCDKVSLLNTTDNLQ